MEDFLVSVVVVVRRAAFRFLSDPNDLTESTKLPDSAFFRSGSNNSPDSNFLLFLTDMMMMMLVDAAVEKEDVNPRERVRSSDPMKHCTQTALR